MASLVQILLKKHLDFLLPDWQEQVKRCLGAMAVVRTRLRADAQKFVVTLTEKPAVFTVVFKTVRTKRYGVVGTFEFRPFRDLYKDTIVNRKI